MDHHQIAICPALSIFSNIMSPGQLYYLLPGVVAFIAILSLPTLTNGQSTEMIICYSNNCTTLYGNITHCNLDNGPYYPKPTCSVPANIGQCYTLDWPASSTRVFGCLTQRSCPFGHKCCSSGNRCNCDENISTVLCRKLSLLLIHQKKLF